MSSKFLWTIPLLVAAVFLGSTAKTFAGESESARGFLWGGTDTDNLSNTGDENGTGWISTNDLDCDTDANGFVDAACGGDNKAIPSMSYGVNIPPADGAVTGYAWSEHYGWVSFNAADLSGCPDARAPQRIGNTLIGWARILSIKTEADKPVPNNAGGWLGCVKLASENGAAVSYGVTINSDNKTLAGFAWSDELGWVDFTRVSLQATKTLKVCRQDGSTVLSGSTLVIPKNSSEQFAAYYGSAIDCAGVVASGDANVAKDTKNTSWYQDENKDVVVGFAGGLLKTGSVFGVESVGATYKGQSVNFFVKLPCTDTTWEPPFDPAKNCPDVKQTQTSNCGTVRDVAGMKSCSSDWTEVAP